MSFQLSAFSLQPFRLRRSRGVALVLVVIVIAILTIMCVAFLQSMRIDRLTARAYLNKVRAEMLAQSAREVALSHLQEIQIVDLEASPARHLATPLMMPALEYADGAEPVHMYLARQEYTRDPTSGAILAFRYVRQPLFSTRLGVNDYDLLTSPAIDTTDFSIEDLDFNGEAVIRQVTRDPDKWVDMNKGVSWNAAGWVGLEDSSQNALSLPVNWIYVRSEEGKVIGRYAFWTDDESSKIDLRLAGNARDAGNHARDNGFNLDEVALLHLNGIDESHLNFRNVQTASEVIRADYRPTWMKLGMGTSLMAPEIPEQEWREISPFVTAYTLFDDRAPNGKRKLNLNAVVTNTTDPATIRNEIILIRDWIKDNLPEFGKRYYRDDGAGGANVSAEDQEIYFLKIAANIRDYIDADSMATVLFRSLTGWSPTGDPDNPQNDFTVFSGQEPGPELGNEIPLSALQDTDLPLAVGKEAGPYLSEYCRMMKVVSESGSGPYDVTLRPVHYVELYNPTGRQIGYNDLVADPANPEPPFIRICNRAPWQGIDASQTPPSSFTFRPVDIIMYLPTDFSISPGGYAVLTTDGAPFVGGEENIFNSIGELYQIEMGGSGGRRGDAGEWKYVNVGGQTNPSGGRGAIGEDYNLTLEWHTPFDSSDTDNRYRLQSNSRSNGYGQNETRILFGNDQGLIDMAVKVYEETNIYVGFGSRNPTFQNTNIAGNQTGTAANGENGPRFSRADPRANTEITVVDANTKSVWIDGLGAYGNNLDSNRVTLGNINHSTNFGATSYQSALPDWSTATNWNHRVANAPMQSLGQLTDIYDPARYDRSHRGGGRTFRIGQADDPANTSPGGGASEGAQNWLGGLGSNDPAAAEFGRNAWLLTDLFRLDDDTSGRISLNAFSRGYDSPALKALFHEFRFNSPSDGGHPDSESEPVKRNSNNELFLGDSIRQILQDGRLPLSAGALGTASIFQAGTELVGDASATIETSDLPMSVREELMRRTLNLVDSRSLAFTVYTVGQTGLFIDDSFRVDGSHWESTTFHLVPVYTQPYDETDPQEPTSWEIRIMNHEIL